MIDMGISKKLMSIGGFFGANYNFQPLEIIKKSKCPVLMVDRMGDDIIRKNLLGKLFENSLVIKDYSKLEVALFHDDYKKLLQDKLEEIFTNQQNITLPYIVNTHNNPLVEFNVLYRFSGTDKYYFRQAKESYVDFINQAEILTKRLNHSYHKEHVVTKLKKSHIEFVQYSLVEI